MKAMLASATRDLARPSSRVFLLESRLPPITVTRWAMVSVGQASRKVS